MISAAAAAKTLQSCPTLCDPIDGSPPGSSVPGILQARYWSGLPFPSPMHACMLSRFSHVQLCATLWTAAHQPPLSQGFSSKNTGVGCHFLLPWGRHSPHLSLCFDPCVCFCEVSKEIPSSMEQKDKHVSSDYKYPFHFPPLLQNKTNKEESRKPWR